MKVISDESILTQFEIPVSYAGTIIEVDVVDMFEDVYFQEKEWGFMFPLELISHDLTPAQTPKGEERCRANTKPS